MERISANTSCTRLHFSVWQESPTRLKTRVPNTDMKQTVPHSYVSLRSARRIPRWRLIATYQYVARDLLKLHRRFISMRSLMHCICSISLVVRNDACYLKLCLMYEPHGHVERQAHHKVLSVYLTVNCLVKLLCWSRCKAPTIHHDILEHVRVPPDVFGPMH